MCIFETEILADLSVASIYKGDQDSYSQIFETETETRKMCIFETETRKMVETESLAEL